MTPDDDFIGQLEGYLEEHEGTTPLPARVRDLVRAQLPTTKQIGGFPMLMRFLTMNRPRQIAVAAVAAVAVSVAALSALSPRFGIGTEPTPTEGPTVDLGIFEPVAGRIVYGDARGIWAVDPASPDPATTVQLASETGIPLGWSSNGTRLLILRDENLFFLQPDRVQDENLFVLHADGSETRVAERPLPKGAATISPDGSRVVFAAENALYAVDADGGPTEMLPLQTHDYYRFEELAFSPDGTRIAYAEGVGDHSHSVWLMDADGTDAHQIVSNEWTAGVGHVYDLAWSPAGDRLAIAIEGSIYTFATDGSDFTRVTGGKTTCESAESCAGEGPKQATSPYWSPDGSQIAYTTGCVEGARATNRDGCHLAIADADGSHVLTFGFGASGPWHPGTLENGAGG